MTVLADTSAWVEFQLATDSPPDLRLVDLLSGPPGVVAWTEPVLMELTAGARTDRAAMELRDMLSTATLLPLLPDTDLESASRIYRRCRSVGVTPRGLIDCVIAAVAQRTGASVLSHDHDLARIADVIGIPLDEASLRP